MLFCVKQAVLILAITCIAAQVVTAAVNWDIEKLSAPPSVYPAGIDLLGEADPFYGSLLDTPELKKSESDVKAIFYEGLPFQGKPTRVFAYIGIPKNAKNVPGIVLVHGGGGTAFESWVRLWNARGYAAIAMDTCGCIPKGSYSSWQRHEWAGPAGWDASFDQLAWPKEDQWGYHAVADIILANSLLGSMPGVDPKRIGITGISWGGYLTCIASGVDRRFKFAVPVYGCGFLVDNSTWKANGVFEKLGAENARLWQETWDPSVYLKNTKMPIMWVTGTNDFAYPLDSLQKSYHQVRGERNLCVRLNMEHGHGGAGEKPAEILAFADYRCRKGTPPTKITKLGRDESKAWVRYTSGAPIAKAELLFSKDGGKWPERKWESVPAVVGEGSVSAALPEGAKVYYFNLIDERGMIVSSEYVEM